MKKCINLNLKQLQAFIYVYKCTKQYIYIVNFFEFGYFCRYC